MGYQIFDLARKINREVNRNTTYRSDPELYGRVEFWNPARGEGDCEDYALAKFDALLAAGVERSRLRLAVVFTETPEGRFRFNEGRRTDWFSGDHAVLVVTCEDGDWVLDNRHDDIFPSLKDVGYDLDRIWNPQMKGWELG